MDKRKFVVARLYIGARQCRLSAILYYSWDDLARRVFYMSDDRVSICSERPVLAFPATPTYIVSQRAATKTFLPHLNTC